MCTCTYICVHVCTYIYMYIHMYICTVCTYVCYNMLQLSSWLYVYNILQRSAVKSPVSLVADHLVKKKKPHPHHLKVKAPVKNRAPANQPLINPPLKIINKVHIVHNTHHVLQCCCVVRINVRT